MKKALLFVFCLWVLAAGGYTQEVQGKRFAIVDQMPEPGFDLEAYLDANMQYPAEALKNKVEGKVVFQFVVDKDGCLSNIEMIKGKNLGNGIPEEAMRLIGNMPPWKPGRQNGKAVKAYYVLPIQFNLPD